MTHRGKKQLFVKHVRSLMRAQRSSSRRRLGWEFLETRQLMAADWAYSLGDVDAHGLIDLSHDIRSESLDPQQLDELMREGHSDPRTSGVARRPFVGPLAEASTVMSGADAGSLAMAAVSAAFTVPVWNSLPGAAASLFLDFDGHFDATWNATTPPLDRDGDPNSLGAEELSFIESVWRIVAEDYAPFNINVTTVEPPELAEGVPDSVANRVAMRLAIGGTEAVLGYTGGGLAGMARINSFSGVGNNVAYVFPESSTSGYRNAAVVGVVASHEAGHAFGLRHLSNAYNVTDRWQGLMNSLVFSYDLAYWMSEINDQGVVQDDMAVLSGSLNGFGYRVDDHGNTIAGATALAYNGSAFVGSGVIAENSDVDVWSLTSQTAESLRVSVAGVGTAQNLDVVLDLLDGNGNVIKSVDPESSDDAEFTIEAGLTQYLRVRSSGEYGRVGQYTITTALSTPGVTVTSPKLLLTSEKGISAAASITLDSRPSADVVVHLDSSDTLEGTLAVNQLVFTPANWYIPQTISVSGVNDAVLDGPKAYHVSLATTSADPNYDNLLLADLPAINADNDAPGWVQQILTFQNVSNLILYDMQVDQDGSFFLVGTFNGTVDFDPSSTTNALTAMDLSTPFLAKYSANGDLIWAKGFNPGDSLTYFQTMTFDGLGNIYMAGYTYSTDLTFGSTVLSNSGSTEAVVVKLNSGGSVIWAKSFGGTGADSIDDMVVDNSGNLVLVGDFAATADFDPSAGVVSRTSAGNADIFLARLSSAGSFLSVSTFGGANLDIARQLAMDPSGNTYINGYFAAETQLGSQSLVSSGATDAFLMKVNSAGAVQWVRQAVSETGGSTATHMALSADGSLLWASAHSGLVQFGPDTPTLGIGAAYGVYITHWDSTGALIQSGYLESAQSMSLASAAWDPENHPVLFGRITATTDFDPTSGVATGQPLGAASDYVLRLNSSLQVLDVTQVPSDVPSAPRRMAVDSRGNILVAGDLKGSIALPTGDVLKNSGKSADLYLLRLQMAPGVTLGGAALQTTETGQSASFTVVLDTRPTAEVTVALTSNDPTEGNVSPAALTFTPSNWNVPQTVTVSGVDDAIIDGDIAYSIGLSLSSTDPLYHGLAVAPVSLVNRDDDQPLLLFSDSFEVGEWNGLWVEDSQNDWSRLNQRATNGSYSAEVDGSAKNATLTTARSIDLSGMQSAMLTFSWLIEGGFDAGEYLALDISTNGGSTWTQDIRRLNGNVSPEDAWQQVTLDLTPYRSSNVKIRFRSTVSASDEDANVDNIRITGIPLGPNSLPVANAGGPYAVNEGGSVVLDARGSTDSDGTILAYAWDFDNDGQYDDATGATPTFTTTVSGPRTIALQVTDDRSGVSIASVPLMVNNVAPIANAGPDKQANVGQTVSLSAAGSTDPGNDIVGYAWDLDNDGVFDDATGATASLSGLAAGTYTIGVRVTDADGASSTDLATVTVTAVPVQTTLFQDSFEVGAWNGLWVEDAQNDWELSTQRATDGSRSAEVDGSASNATLTMAQGVNLSGYAAQTLTFAWLIESGFDTGEYLALDISTDGGSTWTQNIRRLNGNVSSEGVWHAETVDLAAYATTNVKIRFRSSVSDKTEDANVDNVKIVVASGNSAGAMAPAIAAATTESSGSSGQSRTYQWLSLDQLLAGGTEQLNGNASVDSHPSNRSHAAEAVDWLHATGDLAGLDEWGEGVLAARKRNAALSSSLHPPALSSR